MGVRGLTHSRAGISSINRVKMVSRVQTQSIDNWVQTQSIDNYWLNQPAMLTRCKYFILKWVYITSLEPSTGIVLATTIWHLQFNMVNTSNRQGILQCHIHSFSIWWNTISHPATLWSFHPTQVQRWGIKYTFSSKRAYATTKHCHSLKLKWTVLVQALHFIYHVCLNAV